MQCLVAIKNKVNGTAQVNVLSGLRHPTGKFGKQLLILLILHSGFCLQRWGRI
jgi:hypothetical protein